MYIIFYLYLALFVNGFCKAHETVNKLFNIFIGLLKPKVCILDKDGAKLIKSDTPDRILLISNHVKLIDYITLHKVLLELYPEHLPVFVTVDKVKKIPCYGNIFSKYYIFINRKDTNKSMEDMVQRCLELKTKKVVIVLFPEGDIYRSKNVDKSDGYCVKNNIKKFDNVLCPKVKAYDIIVKHFEPEQINLSQLIYKNYNTFIKYRDFLNICSKYPSCDVYLTAWEKENTLMDIWRKLDTSF
jgi:hypothetical protein